MAEKDISLWRPIPLLTPGLGKGSLRPGFNFSPCPATHSLLMQLLSISLYVNNVIFSPYCHLFMAAHNDGADNEEKREL